MYNVLCSASPFPIFLMSLFLGSSVQGICSNRPNGKLMLIFRYTMERPRFTDHLEAIKFICKDFWSELFKKQIDNLKTNHRVINRISHS
jgi:hypothetical protein